MSDRELLELAAKAAGYTIADWRETYRGIRPALHDTHAPGRWIWDPLTDDGDALRLVVKLNLDVNPGDGNTAISWPIEGRHLGNGLFEPHGTDPCAATRRAIVRAAAELGKQTGSEP